MLGGRVEGCSRGACVGGLRGWCCVVCSSVGLRLEVTSRVVITANAAVGRRYGRRRRSPPARVLGRAAGGAGRRTPDTTELIVRGGGLGTKSLVP